MNSFPLNMLVGLGLAVLFTACLGAGYNASITVSGRVVDEQGSPLQQIRLNERRSRFDITSESLLSSSTSTEILDDGQFTVDCSNCSSIDLSFSKDGYYSESVIYRPEKGIRSRGRLTSEVAEDLELADIQIVLRSNENMVQLTRYRGSLEAGTGGPVTVVPMRTDLGSLGVTLERLNQSPQTEDSQLRGYVRLLPALTETGDLALRPQPEVIGASFVIPSPPTLDFSLTGGGIQLDQLASGNRDEVYQAMTTAPADGYQPALTLAADYNSGDFYFYCKIGNQFGKGRVVIPSFGHSNDGQEVVMTFIEIRLNPDGSRNLETAN